MSEQTQNFLKNGEVEISFVDLDGRKYVAKALVGNDGQTNRANFHNTIELLKETVFREFENADKVYE